MKRQLISYLLAVGTAAASLIACTREPETAPEVYDQETEYEVVLTASLAPDTRGVTVTSDAVTATWSADDKVALVYNNKILTALEVTGISGNTAQLSGKVYGAYPTNTAMTLYYGGVSNDFTGIGYDYSGQDGTAASAAARAYLQASVKIAKQENKKLTLGDATTGGAITLAHQQAYYELKFQYGPDVLKVRSVEVTGSTGIVKTRELTANGFGGNNYAGDANDHFTVTTTAAEGLSTVYFVLSDVSTPVVTYTFTVTEAVAANETPRVFTAEYLLESDNVTLKALNKEGGLAYNGTYRSGTWVLDRQTLDPTKPQAQSVVYDAQPHELVTPGSLPYGNGSAEGATIMYYVAPVQAVDAVLDDNAYAALAPTANSTWSTDVPVQTEPGQYYVWYKVIGGRLFKDVDPTPVTAYSTDPDTKNKALIDKRSLSVTPPTGIANLKYTGSAQALINPGTIKDKTSEEFDPGLVMQYCVDSVAIGSTAPTALPANPVWSTDIPSFTNAHDYYIWYKVEGSDHYYGLDATMLSAPVTIQTTDAVIANPVPIEGLVYNGALQQIALPADASDGCKVYYFVTESATTVPAYDNGDWGTWIALPKENDTSDPNYATYYPAPKIKNAGTYYIWTKVVDESGGNNYSGITGVSSAPVVASIAKAPISVTVPACITDWTVYDGLEHTLLQDSPTTAVTYAGVANTDALSAANEGPNQAKLYYQVNSEGWVLYDPTNPNLPKRTDAGNYQVSYMVDGGINFVSKSATTIGTVNVAKVTPTVTPTPAGKTGLSYTGSSQALLAADSYSTNFGTLQFGVSTTSTTAPDSWGSDLPSATNANTYHVFYRVVGNENVNDLNPSPIDVVIAKVDPDYTPPTAKDLTYSGQPQDLVTAGSSEHGTFTYSTAQNGTYTSSIPQGTSAGNYTVWYKFTGDDNHNDIAAAQVSDVKIAKANVGDVTLTPAILLFNSSKGVNSTLTFTVTRSGDGEISVSVSCSSNFTASNLATASVDGTTVIVTRKTSDEVETPQNLQITVSVAEGTNYKALDDAASCSVTMYQYDPLLSGVFTVKAAEGETPATKVKFSAGNLQATTTDGGTNWTWGFAPTQYSVVGNAIANTAISGNRTVSTNGTVDLFGWSTSATYYGIHNSTTSSDYYNNDHQDFVDWGGLIDSGWKTMSEAEWRYLFNSRAASTVHNVENARFAKAYLFGTVHGVILFPDSYTHPSGVAYPTGINDSGNTSWNGNQYSSTDWDKMEDAGCVFLPEAGKRNAATVIFTQGTHYWTSIYTSSSVLRFGFSASDTSLNYSSSATFPYEGNPVRLVKTYSQ